MSSAIRVVTLIAASVLLMSCAQGLQHYRIAGAARREIPKVEAVMDSVAAQAGLARETDDIRDHHSFVAYQKPLSMYMDGSVIDHDVLITVDQAHLRNTPEFRHIDALLRRALVETFPRRVTARPDADVDSPNITQL